MKHPPIEICFDLSRSIDLHKISTKQTGEEAIEGVTSGLISLNETVTWRAKHFGVWQKLITKITEYQRPIFFADEMVKGAFKAFRHEHHFEEIGEETLMIDYFEFQSPFGIVGKLVNRIVLIEYMTNMLEIRNQVIKEAAESDKWKELLNETEIGW
ncbi:SRPBCC family protein [Catalinimonas niigatensis]|uniref:SRPBCC family protein n=1 Tax=Catalinimonas niigatensis TaxID=1397264 RepID=UPI002665AD82|nr:SRPBCC family protein [Catalinimonas niigatensis]WPP50690.1 SRPBCC family protein [Catalinimonas niigatensis]